MSAPNAARTPLALVINSLFVLISILVVDVGYRALFSTTDGIVEDYNLVFFATLIAGSVCYAFLYNKASYLWRPHVNRGFVRAKETAKIASAKMTGIKILNGAFLGILGIGVKIFFFDMIMFGGTDSDTGDSTTTTVLVVTVVLTATMLEWQGRTEDDGDG